MLDALVFLRPKRGRECVAASVRACCASVACSSASIFALSSSCCARARIALVAALQIPGRQQNLALPLGDRALLVAHAAAVAVAALRLQEAPLERLHLDHEQIGLHRLPCDPSRPRSTRPGRPARAACPVASSPAQRRALPGRRSDSPSLLLRAAAHRHGLPFAAVDRVAQLTSRKRKSSSRADAHRHFLDAGRAPVATGLADLDRRLLVGDDLDRVLVAQRDELVRDARADLIAARLRDRDRADARFDPAAISSPVLAVDDERRRIRAAHRRTLPPSRSCLRPRGCRARRRRRAARARSTADTSTSAARARCAADRRRSTLCSRAARAFGIDVVLQRTAHRVELELEARVLILSGGACIGARSHSC